MTDLMPKLKYCLFAVSQPTQKICATPQILLPFKGGEKKILKFLFRSVPCFSKVPVSGVFGILVVFPWFVSTGLTLTFVRFSGTSEN